VYHLPAWIKSRTWLAPNPKSLAVEACWFPCLGKGQARSSWGFAGLKIQWACRLPLFWKVFFVLFCSVFWWFSSLNSGPQACWTGALAVEPHPDPGQCSLLGCFGNLCFACFAPLFLLRVCPATSCMWLPWSCQSQGQAPDPGRSMCSRSGQFLLSPPSW
jgi:hypothetical protein